jgi:hypothetical protein
MGGHAHYLMDSDIARLEELQKSGQLTPETFNPPVTYTGQIAGKDADLHSSTLHAIIARNAPGGSNWIFLAQMCVAAAYDYWEDHYRKAIAEALGLSKNDLVDDAFGELANLRHAIVHNGGWATSKVAANKILPRFNVGELVNLTPQHIHDLMDAVKAAAQRVVALKTRAPAS